MEYLIVVTGHLKQPLMIPHEDDVRTLSEVHNNFIFKCDSLEQLYLNTAGQVRLMVEQGGMFGKKDPSNVVANRDVDMRTRVFVPISNITHLDFDFRSIVAGPMDETGDRKEIIQ